MATFWIQKAIKRKGALRKKLGIKKGKKIPKSKLRIKKGDTLLTRQQKNLAKTLSKFSKSNRW